MEGCREKLDEALKLVGDVESNIDALEGFIKRPPRAKTLPTRSNFLEKSNFTKGN